MTDETTAAIDFQSPNPKGLDVATLNRRIEQGRAICDAAWKDWELKRNLAQSARDDYNIVTSRLKELIDQRDRLDGSSC